MIEMLVAEPLVPAPSFLEVKIAVERCKLSSIDHSGRIATRVPIKNGP
jgi:hypothetical protein